MLVTAYLASRYKKPIGFASFYAAVSAVISTINHLGLGVCIVHLSILVKLKNQIPWVLMLLSFPAIMLFLAFKSINDI